MNSNRIMRSKIYRFLDYLLRLILLNALVVVPSFSFFIIYGSFASELNNTLANISLIPIFFLLFPSVVACFDVIRQYETDETNTIFKDFFKSFKKGIIVSSISNASIGTCNVIVLFYLV